MRFSRLCCGVEERNKKARVKHQCHYYLTLTLCYTNIQHRGNVPQTWGHGHRNSTVWVDDRGVGYH